MFLKDKHTHTHINIIYTKRRAKKKIKLDRQEKKEIDWNVCTSKVNNGYKRILNIRDSQF